MAEQLITKNAYPKTISEATQELLRNAGAGSVSDYAKQAKREGGALTLTAEEARDSGAGFVQDVLKSAELQPPPPEPIVTTAVVNIQNALNPAVTVDAAVWAQFTTGSVVTFTDTGNATLNGNTFTVISVNTVGKTFKIATDLSTAPAPIRTGTISLMTAGGEEPVYDPPQEE
jgi:hypothetical protein